jgi:dTMP kinase
MSMVKGINGFRGFISFEGIEGSGKSTQAKLLAAYLRTKGHNVLVTEEPGGTKIGHKIRSVLLDTENQIDPLTELLLYISSRAQHIRELIYPALTRNSVVITDRFADSTVAYQGYARGIDLTIIKTLDEIVTSDLKPSVTFLLDMDIEEGLKRNRKASKQDRFELETIEFHTRVRNGYLQIAKEEPNRIRVIPASGTAEEVSKKIIGILETLWA